MNEVTGWCDLTSRGSMLCRDGETAGCITQSTCWESNIQFHTYLDTMQHAVHIIIDSSTTCAYTTNSFFDFLT